ncbi:MAG: UDP-3-O-[3-hydroxymyristoyl] N-acetylglucosamine deacetylase [Bacteroidetes bacterium HGW-Bacteroidetes-7]|jgi:UDP-3-O-[3-hydroxymyristoyl] N-acetylglucosamine deacetylase/3-hydroxyacyl-[acyl-carrier-protein] dehydratase|nr:MAG: UDP-3-O-[3-hydroxymyristoyl] N-acetylglucosamine deacetylase [Bacteroidetes bacterium HGW-Bacteroidetes-7]
MQANQQTIKNIYTFRGKGLHTGSNVTMRLLPAPENHGIKFRRTDIEGKPTIEASADNVKFTDRGTVLEASGARISTVEHVMSALYALGADNVLIEIDGDEVPILDGSTAPYAEPIASDGLVEQSAVKRVFVVKEKIHYKDEETGSEITIFPDDTFSADVMIDFNSKVLGTQFARYTKDTDYTKEIAPCRTFVFMHDLEMLFKNNLIKGGDIDNAIVIAEKPLSEDELVNLSKIFSREQIKSVKQGYVNIDEPRFSNECARHKLADLLGDLALSGVKIIGKVSAVKPGHKINTKVAAMIKSAEKENAKLAGIPRYNPDDLPVIDIAGIKKLLPHRPPFLMVDRIIELGHERVVGIKTIGINEGFFLGHFPDEPVMPGVLIIEAMAQVGGILVLSDLDEPDKYSTYFAKIDNAKFKRKVVPGDVLTIVLTLTAPLRRSIVSMRGEVFVGNSLACEADMVAQVIKNKE